MSIITTYVCDISGVQGKKEDFVDVQITAIPTSGNNYMNTITVTKIIHKDVAIRLHLLRMTNEEAAKTPEPTLESKLMTLMKEYITELAYEAGGEAGNEAASNYNRGG